ncbi:hypothetical protein F4821DRAFT_247252 [Hypoxylon rubiginosum]|uniref:Uncharacterized protein n=1 Tax=Hypoxylon rubiginosum TaxID=110542 RepID=A0ACC0CQ10_9PEZI|nr:hypothetical protein F4821DRAFT_247252 [Hypoxylon rubiginosum]
MSGQALSFDRLRGEQLSLLSTEDELDILDLFEQVMNSSPDHNVEETSQRFVDGLTKLAPGKNLGDQSLPRSTCVTNQFTNDHLGDPGIYCLGRVRERGSEGMKV